MINQREGETELKVKSHYDDMVSSACSALNESIDSLHLKN